MNKIIQIIDLVRMQIGLWIAFKANTTLTATSIALQQDYKSRKCIHCGKNPYTKFIKKIT